MFEKEIYFTLFLFSLFDRPLSIFEIWRYLFKFEKNKEVKLSEIFLALENSSFLRKKIISKNGFYTISSREDLLGERRETDILLDLKLRKLKKKIKLLKFIPFLEGGFLFGSMALGNVKKESDFDLFLISKKGRIWSLRFFSILIFELFLSRRKGVYHSPEKTKDKICLSHFVSQEGITYDQRNYYQAVYYANLIPLFGREKLVEEFFEKNSWLNDFFFNRPFDFSFPIFQLRGKFFLTKLIERILSGEIGNFFEKILRFFQIKRIKKSFKKIKTPHRIRFSDKELEFHPDIRREIEFNLKVKKGK